jgi:hypothetical protein
VHDLTCDVSSNIYSVREIQAEYDSLSLVSRPAAFALLELLVQVVACEDAGEHAP